MGGVQSNDAMAGGGGGMGNEHYLVEGSQLSSVSKLILARIIRKIKVEHAERNPHRVLLRTRRAVEGQVE